MRARTHASATRCLLLTAVGLAVALAAAAQQHEEARRHGIFQDTVGVNLTNVEVYVSRNGAPVDDLVAEDFEILEDGKPVEITHFSRAESGQRVAGGAATPDSETSVDDPVPPEARERSTVVILVDQFLLSPGGRKRVLDELSLQLDRLMSDDTRIIVVNKGLRLEVVLAPTSDPAEVRAALDRLAGRAMRNPASESYELLENIQRLEEVAEEGESFASAIARSTFTRLYRHSQQLHGHIRTSLGLLESFVRSLGGLDGRKAVVYVADRLPVRPAENAWFVWFDAFGEQFGTEMGMTSPQEAVQEFDLSTEVERLVAEANANRVVFYATGVGRATGDVSSVASARLVGRTGQGQDGLRWLAEGTGGSAALGRFDGEEFFGRLQQDLTHYYSLAYQSPQRGDGKVHRVRVKVRREGVEVRYLSRYRDRSLNQQLERPTLASLQFGLADNPLEVEVTHGEAEKQRGGRFVLPLEVRFPLANLVLLADRKTHNGRISIRVIALDDKGRFSDPVVTEAPIEIPHEELLRALSRKAVFKAQLTLRKGAQTVAVDVRDEVGSVTSTVLLDVDLGGGG